MCKRSRTSCGIRMSKWTFQGWSLRTLAVRRRFMPFFACTIVCSNVGYRLVISIFCRCQSGPNFPFTMASDTFTRWLNVPSKSLNLCPFEISLWNFDFCRPKARFTPLMACCMSGSLLFTVPRFLAAPAKVGAISSNNRPLALTGHVTNATFS